jgi:hypothetical protein
MVREDTALSGENDPFGMVGETLGLHLTRPTHQQYCMFREEPPHSICDAWGGCIWNPNFE